MSRPITMTPAFERVVHRPIDDPRSKTAWVRHFVGLQSCAAVGTCLIRLLGLRPGGCARVGGRAGESRSTPAGASKQTSCRGSGPPATELNEAGRRAPTGEAGFGDG